jgi:hypothetical protein
MWTIIFPLQA